MVVVVVPRRRSGVVAALLRRCRGARATQRVRGRDPSRGRCLNPDSQVFPNDLEPRSLYVCAVYLPKSTNIGRGIDALMGVLQLESGSFLFVRGKTKCQILTFQPGLSRQ